MDDRDWVELIGQENAVAFSLGHVSCVQKLSKGSAIVCGGIRYELPNVEYEDALKMAKFVRTP